MIREIKNDQDALDMALGVDDTGVISVYAKVDGIVKLGDRNEREDGIAQHVVLEKQLEDKMLKEMIMRKVCQLGKIGKNEQEEEEEEEEGSDLHDLEHSFDSGEEEEDVDSVAHGRPNTGAEKRIKGVGKDGEDNAQPDYDASDKLQSYTSTYDKNLDPRRHKYAELNEEFDMKDPHFKIGM